MSGLQRAVGLALAFAGMLACPMPRAAASPIPQNDSVEEALAAMPPESRGDLLLARGQYLAAVDAYKEATPTAQILNKMGIAYHHLLAIDLAEQDYKKALLIRPDYPEAINNLGAAYFAKHDYRKAIKLYRRALELMPTSAVVAANLGTAYFAREQYKPGLQAYRVAFQLDPNVFANDNFGIIAGPTRRADRARQDYSIAELFAQAGNEPRAIEYLRKALDEGFTDRNKIMQDALFAKLRETSEFAQLMAEQKVH
ncbi:MAG TPA: tetratricopeptide repeat protein [Acidobacteriaceae bacterium]